MVDLFSTTGLSITKDAGESPLYENRLDEYDWANYDAKTPLLCPLELKTWHQRMAFAVQLEYHY